MAEVKTIIRYSVKYFLAAAVPAAFVLSLLSKPILLVLTTPAIATNGYLITPFTAVSGVLFGVWSIIAIVLTFEKRTAIIGTIWVLGAALNIGLNLVLVPYFGIIAAALTTLLGYGFIFGVTAIYSIRHMTLDIDFGFILKSIFASIVISPLVLIWHASGLLSISALIVICAVVYTAILFVLKGFTASEIRFFSGFLAGQR
jgi:O-antigen/teichoic acid export membrane protein